MVDCLSLIVNLKSLDTMYISDFDRSLPLLFCQSFKLRYPLFNFMHTETIYD